MTTAFVFPGLNGAAHAAENVPLLRRPGFVGRWQTVTKACRRTPGFAEFAAALHAGRELPLSPATWPWRALAVVAMQLAMAEELEARGENADWLCGYSVGDVARSCHAGAFTFDELVAFAAGLSALPVTGGATACAQAGADVDLHELQRRVEAFGALCSRLSPRFLMFAGTSAVVDAAQRAARGRGVRAKEIATCALHSPQQRSLGSALAQALASHRLRPVQRDVFSTLWGRPLSPADDLRAELVANVTSPCDFATAIRRLHDEHGVTRFIDLGPGRHAQRFVRHHDLEVEALGAGDLVAVTVLRA